MCVSIVASVYLCVSDILKWWMNYIDTFSEGRLDIFSVFISCFVLSTRCRFWVAQFVLSAGFFNNFRVDFRVERAAIIIFIFFILYVLYIIFLYMSCHRDEWTSSSLETAGNCQKKLLAVCVCDISQQKNIGHLSTVVHFQNRYKCDRWFGMLVCCFLKVQFYRCLHFSSAAFDV